MKEFRKYFGGLERDFGFCNVNNGYHDPQTNKLNFVQVIMVGLKEIYLIKIIKII